MKHRIQSAHLEQTKNDPKIRVVRIQEKGKIIDVIQSKLNYERS